MRNRLSQSLFLPGCWGATKQLWNAFHNCFVAPQHPTSLLQPDPCPGAPKFGAAVPMGIKRFAPVAPPFRNPIAGQLIVFRGKTVTFPLKVPLMPPRSAKSLTTAPSRPASWKLAPINIACRKSARRRRAFSRRAPSRCGFTRKALTRRASRGQCPQVSACKVGILQVSFFDSAVWKLARSQ